MWRATTGLLMAFAAGSAWAAQEVNVTSACNQLVPQFCPYVALPNSAPFNAMGSGSLRFTMRINNMSAGPAPIVLGAFEILVSGSTLTITNFAGNPPVTDSLGASSCASNVTGLCTGQVIACCTSRTDVMLELQRDATTGSDSAIGRWTLTLRDTAGTNSATATYPITSAGQASWVGFPMTIASGYHIAWLRWFSTTAPIADTIRNAGVTGDVADWEFEGTMADSVSGLTFCTAACSGGAATVAYSTTPSLPPYADCGDQQTFKTGVTGTVTGVQSQPLDGSSALASQAWTYAGAGTDGVTQSTIAFGSATALATTVSGLVRGSVNLTLSLVQGPGGAGNTASCTIHDGAVTVDSRDVVITGLSQQDKILGPVLRLGSPNDPAPWRMTQIKKLADLQAAALATNFPDYWNVAEPGTIAFSPTQTCGGSAAGSGVIGTGTTFTNYAAGGYVVIWWNGGANRRLFGISLVVSNTCLWITAPGGPIGGSTEPWSGGTTESGQSFSVTGANSQAINAWQFDGTAFPGMYYDGPKAFLHLYVSSGIDTYWTAYTYAADNFWASPSMDKGQSYVTGFQSNALFPMRSQSLEGMMLRALDSGMSAMWVGIRIIITLDIGRLGASPCAADLLIYDQRECGYAMTFLSEHAMLDPGGGAPVAASIAALSAAFPALWTPVRAHASDNSFPSMLAAVNQKTLGDGMTCSVNATNGSTTVTANAGCAAFTGMFPASAPFFVTFSPYGAAPSTNAGFRQTVYKPTVVNGTTLTLDIPYVEATCSGGSPCGWSHDINSGDVGTPYPVGYMNQPFILGIVQTGFGKTTTALSMADPTNSALALTYGQGLEGWQRTVGYDPVNGGVTYFTNALNCAPYPASCTLGYSPSQTRTDALEAIRGLADIYQLAPTAAALAFGNLLYCQMWAKPGTGGKCVPDGNYITDYDDGGQFMSNAYQNLRWLDFAIGFGGAGNWAAIAAENGPFGGATISGKITISGKAAIH